MKPSYKRVMIYELGFATFLAAAFVVMQASGIAGALAFVGWIFLVMQVFILGPVVLQAFQHRLRNRDP